eukprot:TRINITY_DN1315_c0_g1_i10.p1 TRINITY_DN1315_c0_g1~~TRINITY_DN1315_c0_g1_i10.p1  ORF type:complete len:1075 (+),score=344.84 TRINITY_DN1315_c0_g1_i10:244-3468(+)
MPKGDLKYLEGGKKSSDEEIRAGLRHLSEKEKLEAMKQILGLMSMGKDTSDLFPDVVMNVVCQSLELKKLVYTYLLRYAAEKADVALLSINTFQKDMEHSNQLIRALALRVLSGLGVPVINQLVLLAIKKASSDPSPYVRKTAAYAIPKLYRMDPDQLPALLEILQTLLNDRMVLVLSGAIATFNEICPSHLELLHPFYRKLCHMLVDMDEWGQIVLLNLLLRYGRTQFLNPVKPKKPEKVTDGKKKKKKKEKSFYSDDDSEDDPDFDDDYDDYMLDEDHKLLLKCAQPLLQSRNSGVVMAVAALYWHLADENESAKVARPMVRLLRSHREVQAVVLSNIATWCCSRPTLFKAYLNDFYVKGDDGKSQRELKLEILVHLVDMDNISTVLKEFQTYVKHPDKHFVALTIQSLGRCAAQMESVAETCLRYLMTLIRSKTDAVVSESVNSIRHLLQHHSSFVKDGVSAMTFHLSKITVPKARASIAWLIGEFIDQVPMFGPDALRLLLKNFADQELVVRMQTLNLGCKVYLNNKDQSEPYVRYMFDLCRYDNSYDLRDRARLLRATLMDGDSQVKDVALPLLRSQKPAPTVSSAMKDRQRYCTGSLSQLVNHTALGYIPLAEFPMERPDPSVRDAPVNTYGMTSKKKKKKTSKSEKKVSKKNVDDLDRFYNDESSEDSEESDEEESDEEESSDESSSESDFETRKGFYDSVTSESEDSENDSEDESDEESSSKDSDDDSDTDSDDESSSEDSDAAPKPFLQIVNQTSDDLLAGVGGSNSTLPQQPASMKLIMGVADSTDDSSSDDDLLGNTSALTTTGATTSGLGDLGDIFGDSPAPGGVDILLQAERVAANITTESFLPKTELLNHVTARGLGVECQFVRTLGAMDHNVIRLFIKNHTSSTIQSIKVSKGVEGGGQTMVPFNPISSLAPGASSEVTINVNFNNKTQPARFEISDSNGDHKAALQPRVGELFYPEPMDLDALKAKLPKLQGMHKVSGSAAASSELIIVDVVAGFANIAFVAEEDNTFYFSGKALAGGLTMFLVIKQQDDHEYSFDIHLENAILASSLSSELKKLINS